MQLKVEDLRVGNAFVQQGSSFVEFATIGDLVRIHEESIIAEPIPLTEELLTKKLGAKRMSKNQEYLLHGIRICNTIDKGYCWVDNEVGFVELPYLHTLQNLVKLLTNTELTCN